MKILFYATLLLLVLLLIVILQLSWLQKCEVSNLILDTLQTNLSYPPSEMTSCRCSHSLTEPVRDDWPIRPPVLSNNTICTQKYSEYSLVDTEHFQQILATYQNPSNCSEARYLVLDTTSNTGFGSGLHLRTVVFMLALNARRILIDSNDDISWQFAPSHCRIQAPECNFLPLTHCALPPNWRETSVDASLEKRTPTADDPRRFIHLVNYFAIPHHERVDIFPEFADRSPEWWNAQLVRYVMRPNHFTLSEVIAPARRAIFPPSGTVPEIFASIFMRRGDRESGKEGRIYSAGDYFNALDRPAREYNITSVFVMSDSQQAIDDALGAYSSRYRIFHLPWKGRSRDGWGWDFVAKKQQPELEGLYLSQLGSVTISELFIAAQSLVFVGTIRSNQCRMLQELRLASGNLCTEYISLE